MFEKKTHEIAIVTSSKKEKPPANAEPYLLQIDNYVVTIWLTPESVEQLHSKAEVRFYNNEGKLYEDHKEITRLNPENK